MRRYAAWQMPESTPIELLIRALSKAPDPLTVTIAKQRAATEALASAAQPDFPVISRNDKIDGVPGAWIETEQSRPSRVIFYVHGGAFVAGSVSSHLPLTAALARHAEARVFAVDYPLAPEHPFPAALRDCELAFDGICHLGTRKKMAVVADSAGASLALALLMRQEAAPGSNCDAAALMCPWVDLSCAAPGFGDLAKPDPLLSREFLLKMAGHYLAGHDPVDPAASPIHGDLSGLPPLLIQSGTRDLLHADAQALEREAIASGIECRHSVWADMIHMWHAFPAYLPQAQEALIEVGEFLVDAWHVSDHEADIHR